ncbi:transglycosylase domain-containing protein [Methylobacterium oryzisoli]|uniref:transglycosylase domain-containing protein n=1 Tax=Methylobacterium oryzisoli TaxID=3385502 RepID=UPI0038922DCC
MLSTAVAVAVLAVGIVSAIVAQRVAALPDDATLRMRLTSAHLLAVPRRGEPNVLDIHCNCPLPVRLEHLPLDLPYAVIKREDRRFLKHAGVNVASLLSATRDTVMGRPRGGSTITMQLAKNTLLDPNDRGHVRKLVEIWAALRIERVLSKREILEAYLNIVPFPGNRTGIEQGAQYLFNKSASALTQVEAAAMAATLHGPNRYDFWRLDPQGSGLRLSEIRKIQLYSRKERFGPEGCARYKRDLERSFIQSRFPGRSPDAPLTREERAPLMAAFREVNTLSICRRQRLRAQTMLVLDAFPAPPTRATREQRRAGLDRLVTVRQRPSAEPLRLETRWYVGFALKELARQGLVREERVGDALVYRPGGTDRFRAYLALGGRHQHAADLVVQRAEEQDRAAALVDLTPDGFLVALASRAVYPDKVHLNLATAEPRPIASLAKAVVLATALADKRTLASPLWDEESAEYRNERCLVKGGRRAAADLARAGRAEGRVELRHAFAASLNCAFVNLAFESGRGRRIKTLWAHLGLPDMAADNLQLALGGFSATPLQMAAVYATLVGGGARVEPRAIRDVAGLDGGTLRPPVPAQPGRFVVGPSVAAGMREALRHVAAMDSSRAGGGQRLHSTVAAGLQTMKERKLLFGKTGTSDGQHRFGPRQAAFVRDGWFVGGVEGRSISAHWTGQSADRSITGAVAARDFRDYRETLQALEAGARKGLRPGRAPILSQVAEAE